MSEHPPRRFLALRRFRWTLIRTARTGRRWLYRKLGIDRRGRSGQGQTATGKNARRARREGHLQTSIQLAERTLSRFPHNKIATEVLAASSDEYSLLGHPLPRTPRAELAHDVRDRSVVYVAHNTLPWNSGGYATRTHGIVSALAAMDWDVAVASRYGYPYDRWPKDLERIAPEEDVVDGMTYHRLLDADSRRYPTHPFEDYTERFAVRLESYARERGARLLHAGSFFPLAYATERAAHRLGIPAIYEVRGLEYLAKVSVSPSFFDTERYHYLLQQEVEGVSRADRAMVITKAIFDEMVRQGVDPDHMRVLPNGVHVDRFAPVERDRELEARLRLEGKVVIGYIGSLVYYEGLDLLLRAAATLKTKRRDFHVLIVGDGTAMTALTELDAQLGTGDVVTFTGRVPHDAVDDYYSLLDVSTIPRLPLPICELVSPMKPFEAMAMEKAMLVSDVAALTEIVEDEVTGLTFRKGDAESYAVQLERLIDDPELRARLGKQARDWVVRERDWSVVVRTADEVYRELLEG